MNNPQFRPVALEHASRLINHGPTVLVTSAAGAQRIMASGAFGLCLPGAALVDLTYAVGGESGSDKFARHGITAIDGPVLGVPLIEVGCAAWLECRLIREVHAEDAYDTCFAEVVAAAADERIFANGHWLFTEDNAELQTIHHLGAGHFVRAGPSLVFDS